MTTDHDERDPLREEKIEVAARGLCEYGVLTVDGEVATWERNHGKLRQMARVALNCAASVKSVELAKARPDTRDRLRAERNAAILERDEMRGANITPEDAERPLGQSVEYWQDRCLDHATAFDKMRVERDSLRTELDAAREALRHAIELGDNVRSYVPAVFDLAWDRDERLAAARAGLPFSSTTPDTKEQTP